MRILTAVLLCLTSFGACADYSTHPKAAELLSILRQDFGFSDAEIANVNQALVAANKLPQLVEQEQKAPEKTENWTQYSRRVDDARVQGGVRLLQEQAPYLARAEEQFGVQPAVIAAIMGIETRYGRITGKIRVLDALTTQGFDHPTRSRFFISELAQFFAFCRDFGFNPQAPQGSYAGAMGAAQFMPSNYRRLALDYDGDGRRDLWQQPDAIGSIANYFVNYRPSQAWRRGEPLAVPARLHGALSADIERNGHTAAYTVGALARAGVTADIDLPADLPAGLVELPLDNGVEYWIAFHNFYTVMTYNPRIFYAMSVTQLAQRIQQQAGTVR